MITETVMWDDLMVQFNKWVASGLAPNSGAKSYFTGYQGLTENESIQMIAFQINEKKWQAMCRYPSQGVEGHFPTGKRNNLGDPVKLMYFTTCISRSGGTVGVWDFKCATGSQDLNFTYHIIRVDG